MHLPVCSSKPSKISASVLHGPRDLRLVSASPGDTSIVVSALSDTRLTGMSR